MKLLSDCEFLTKGSALRIWLLTSSCYPSESEDICQCYPMKAEKDDINHLLASSTLRPLREQLLHSFSGRVWGDPFKICNEFFSHISINLSPLSFITSSPNGPTTKSLFFSLFYYLNLLQLKFPESFLFQLILYLVSQIIFFYYNIFVITYCINS